MTDVKGPSARETERRALLRDAALRRLHRQMNEVLSTDGASDAVDPLDREWLVRAVDWLREKWGDSMACPYCTNHSWTVDGPAAAITPDWPEMPDADTSALWPFFLVSCENCGHTVFVNAITAGVLSPDDGDEQ